MRKITFLEIEGLEPINVYEKNYWRKALKSNIKIGIEVECGFNGSSNACREDIRRILDATGNYRVFGKSGINEVKGDGSLMNGAEITTVGRKVSFLEMYMQYKALTDIILNHNPELDSHAGLHNHILFDYSNNHNNAELPFNSLVFRNFMQLIRRHYPEIVWLTSTVRPTSATRSDVITRNNYFCYDNTLMSTNIKKSISDYCRAINNSGRYAAVNLNPMSANGDDIRNFHVEFRFPDGSIYPAQMAAQGVLYLALLLKAVDLSEIGLVSVGEADDWNDTKMLVSLIRNSGEHNMRNRCSYAPSEEIIEKIKERANDMLLFLKPSICSIEPKVMPILRCLAEKPVSMMRREMSDKDVNEYFESVIAQAFHDTTDTSILHLIATCSVVGANSMENWCYKAADTLGKKYEDVKGSINTMGTLRKLKFDSEIGSMIEE